MRFLVGCLAKLARGKEVAVEISIGSRLTRSTIIPLLVRTDPRSKKGRSKLARPLLANYLLPKFDFLEDVWKYRDDVKSSNLASIRLLLGATHGWAGSPPSAEQAV